MNPAFLLGTAFNIAYWHRKYHSEAKAISNNMLISFIFGFSRLSVGNYLKSNEKLSNNNYQKMKSKENKNLNLLREYVNGFQLPDHENRNSSGRRKGFYSLGSCHPKTKSQLPTNEFSFPRLVVIGLLLSSSSRFSDLLLLQTMLERMYERLEVEEDEDSRNRFSGNNRVTPSCS